MKYIAFALALLATLPASAADLNVKVEGIRNNTGMINLAVFAGEDYLKFDKLLTQAQIQANSDGVTFTLTDLAPGSYSLAITHDENENGELDTNFMGIPTEGVAASNNAKGFMGPPSAEATAFDLPEEGTSQTITLDY